MSHEQQTQGIWFLPVAEQLLQRLADKPLQLVMDGSTVGRGCMALMVSVVYHGRALPLCCLVVRGKKGHLPEELHRTLLHQVHSLVPAGAKVTFLGDGEFDGVGLQGDCERYGWQYVCRTATNICLRAFGVELTVGMLAPQRGELLALTPVLMTAQRYGPVSILALWQERCDEALYLVTNMADLDAAFAAYQKRPHIETFFSDQKSRGFHIHKSHLSDPARLTRLLVASCLAYVWLVYLGVCAVRDGLLAQIHRKDRCDLSLFRLGLRLVARCLNEEKPIPDGFLPPAEPPAALVPC